MKKGGVWIGTSGWVYKEWAGHFYPKGWPKKDEFSYYVRHFPTVEINATFYRLPSLQMVRGWRERSPEGFVFAVKGSRHLTHIKRLSDTGPGLRKYFARLRPLAERTGPILWQLPPTFPKNVENERRLATFLNRLPKHYAHAVEFRHPSWMDEHTFALLRKHRVTNVWISSLKMPQDHAITGDFVYLRFQGLKDGAYHDYPDDELRPWAEQLAKAAARGIPAYVYFNNDLNTRAPLNAASLVKMLGKHAVAAFAAEPSPLPEIAPPVKGAETWRPWRRLMKKESTSRTRNGKARNRMPERQPHSLTTISRHRHPTEATTGPQSRRRRAATAALR